MNDNEELLEKILYLDALIRRFQLSQTKGNKNAVSPHRGQGRVLLILSMQEEMTQKQLGYLLDMRNQSLGEILSKLEQKELITRIPSLEDKRTTMIKITPKGKHVVDQMNQESEKHLDLFTCLNDDEKNHFNGYLERIIASLKQQLVELGIDGEEFDYTNVREFFNRRRSTGFNNRREAFGNMMQDEDMKDMFTRRRHPFKKDE